MTTADLTVSGQESLSIRISALKGSLLAIHNGAPGAEDSARRLARSLRAFGRSYGLPEIIEPAWITEDAAPGAVAPAARELLALLGEIRERSRPRPLAILVVEDDPDMASLLRRLLSTPGHEVLHAGSLAEATRILADCSVTLVILDLTLPDGDGRDLLLRLRETPATVALPVVVLSAEARPDHMAECYALGADEYFHKQDHIQVLAAAISAKLRREAEMGRASRVDGLTGLPNRLALGVAFDQLRRHARRTGRPLSLALIDLDHFKEVNDVHGHLAGDEALVGVCKLLVGCLRDSDFVARWGGEELAVLFPDTHGTGARDALEKVQAALRTELLGPDGNRFRVTFSGGVTEVGGDDRLEAAVAAADRCLYVAKAAGRDRIEGR